MVEKFGEDQLLKSGKRMKRFKKYIIYIISVLGLALIASLFTNFQENNKDEIQAAMVYNFIKYAHWPVENSEMKIGIYQNQELYNILHSRYDNHQQGTVVYKIIDIKNITDVTSCNVVYIGRNKDFDAIFQLCDGKPIMTITYSDNLGKCGSMINMKIVNEKLKFEINTSTVDKSGLKISRNLTSIGIVI